MRVPGCWSAPEDLQRSLPEGYTVGPGWLAFPDGGRVGLVPLPPDKELPALFTVACREKLSPRDRRTVEGYRVAIGLSAPGGSIPAARRMVEAAAAVVRAGGAGVLVDNCGAIHASGDWIELAEGAAEDDLLVAYVKLIMHESQVFSIGMQVFGLADAAKAGTADPDDDRISVMMFLRYSLSPPVDILDGDLAGDADGPRFRLKKRRRRGFLDRGPMRNPYGCWRLVPLDGAGDGHMESTGQLR